MAKIMVTASELQTEDVICVPLESCVVKGIKPVKGTLHKRKQKMYEFTVIPLSGPWAGVEGSFVAEGSDELELIKRKTTSFFTRLKEFFSRFSGKQVSLPPPPPQLSGPMT